jgi:hypothetical protein
VEIFVGARVMLAAAPQQELAEEVHGVLGQLGLSEQLGADLVITDEVPAVNDKLITQMEHELGHRHLASGPGDHRVRFAGKHLL